MTVHALVNPRGGTRGALQMLEAARPYLGDLVVHPTERPGHAEELAATLDADALLAVGGDGTVHEVVNGVRSRAAGPIPVGILPAGSGNDLARSLGIPMQDPAAAARIVTAGRTRAVDVARVRVGDETRDAVVVAFWGYAVDLALFAERNRWMGLGRYTAAGFAAFLKQRPRPAVLRLDGEEIRDEFSLFFAFNTEAAGRGDIVAKGARVDDGLWDVVWCRALNQLHLAEVLAVMARGDGTILDSPHVEHRQVRSLELVPEREDPVDLDGEWVRSGPVTLTVEPGAVRFFSA